MEWNSLDSIEADMKEKFLRIIPFYRFVKWSLQFETYELDEPSLVATSESRLQVWSIWKNEFASTSLVSESDLQKINPR